MNTQRTRMVHKTVSLSLPTSPAGDAARSSLSDRRNSLRGPATRRARLTVLLAAGAGAAHDVLTREQPSVGVSFMLHEGLTVGQRCEIQFETGPKRTGEVVRSRPISNGRWEMAVQLQR